MFFFVNVEGHGCLSFCTGVELSGLFDGDTIVFINVKGHTCLIF